MSKPILISVYVVAAIGVLLALIAVLPRPLSTVDRLCADSPVPSLCRRLERSAGAPAAPDLAPWDIAPADALDRPLVAGQQALAGQQWVTAWRTCKTAADVPGVDQVGGLICQSRAAIGLGWPLRAVNLARRAVLLQEEPDALLALAEALIADSDCRQARPILLRVLELRPQDPAARDGLRRCVVDLPGSKPDLTGHLEEPHRPPRCRSHHHAAAHAAHHDITTFGPGPDGAPQITISLPRERS